MRVLRVLSCPITKHNVPGQGSNPDRSILERAQLTDVYFYQMQLFKEYLFLSWQLINAQNKMKEMYDLMDSVNVWIDDGQGMMKEHKEDMSDEENENLKKRAQVH